jgi:hypothetical protein
MIGLVLGIVNALSAAFPSAQAAAPPPVIPTVDTSGVLDLEQSPEEKMVGDGLPPTPESGSENAEDLLKSSPVIKSARKPTKSASAKENLPSSLPLEPAKKTAKAAKPEELPPLPPATPELPPTTDAAAVEVPPESAAPAELPPPEAVAETPSSPASGSESGTSTTKWDRKIPAYDRENPTWAFELHGSGQALGTPIKSAQLDTNNNPTGVTEDNSIANFGFGFDYEPKFLQSFGVVGLGPTFNSYIAQPAGDLTKGPLSIYSLGFSAQYQLKFMRGQPVVPFVGYEYQEIRYSFQRGDDTNGWTGSSGLTFGALILLNWMEPSAAFTLFAETGIRRSYLVVELKNLQAGLNLLSSDGDALYFGIRLEY